MINFNTMNGNKAIWVCISIQNKIRFQVDEQYCKRTFNAACNQAAATGACNKYRCENCPLAAAHTKAMQRINGGKPIIIE